MNNKVKFLRGTADEYTAAEKDNDTIYFTTDNGKLYIGDKEVSGSDITIDSKLSNTSENPVQNKVINAALNEKASKDTMTGATSSAAGTSGLVPAPASGDQNKFLRGDGTWQTVNSGGGSGGSSYRKMTAIIDMENSNPETSVTYADDAVNMTPKSSEWDAFFGEYPVLFKDGIEIGKLNPNDFTQFEDGTSADITTGESGDVMIAFPRRGVKISTTYDNKLIVSMTDDPNNSDFTYYAHERGITSKDVFYLGAYEGSLLDDKLRSLSGKDIKTYTDYTFTTQAENNGNNYAPMSFYQFTFIQCMYILKYKNLNSQEALGQGYTGGSSTQATGTTNTNGMDYGTTDSLQSVKLFGLEDIWGNVFDYVCGIKIDSNRYICTNINNSKLSNAYFVTDIQTAAKNGYLASLSSASSEIGFVPSSGSKIGGSSTTYFCDWTDTSSNGFCASVGGNYSWKEMCGIFCIFLKSGYLSAGQAGTRLMYL